MQKPYMRLLGLYVLSFVLMMILSRLVGLYYLHVLDVALINILLAIGLNFVVGFGGQISMAQASFFGIGAYTYSILATHHVPVPLDIVLGIIVSALIGLLLAWPALKLKGHYLALATLGFAVIMEELMTNLNSLTGGANGMNGIPGFSLGSFHLNTDGRMFVLLSIVVLLSIALSASFNKSPVGMRTRALRDDDTAASAVGINVSMVKLSLFVISAAFGGLAGVLYCGFLGYISPDVFAWSTTFNYLVMVVVGGLGTTSGPVLGAVLFTLVPEWLRFLKESYLAVFGLVVIIMMATAPEGFVGLINKAISSVKKIRLGNTKNMTT